MQLILEVYNHLVITKLRSMWVTAEPHLVHRLAVTFVVLGDIYLSWIYFLAYDCSTLSKLVSVLINYHIHNCNL